MTRAARSVLAVVLAFVGGCVLLVTGSLPANACSCKVGPPTTRAEADARRADADAVFLGTLVSRRDTPPGADAGGSSADPAWLTFTVDRVFKGDVTARQEVRTARSGATCGLDVPADVPYLLFVDRAADGVLTASACGGSTSQVGLATWDGAPPAAAAPAATPTTPIAPTTPTTPTRPAGTGTADAVVPGWLLAATTAAGAVALAVVGRLVVVRRRHGAD